MPVALSEWRVRIGTFIHRIKEWVVREMREELLKERIQRLRVLWKRLKAKKADSEGGSQDKEVRQDEMDSSDSSLGNQQGDCNAEPCTKGDQDSPPSSCVEKVHHKPSNQKATSQTESASLSTPTHSKVSLGLCLSRPFLSSFLSPSFYCCFFFIFLLFSSLCLPLSPAFGLLSSVSLSFVVVFPFLLSLFLSPFLPFSRREQSFGECHTCTASPSNYGSGTNEAVDEQLPQQPNLQELMLVTAGDVELNPGPRGGTIDSALQDMELVLLAKDVPGDNYYELSIGLGFSLTEGQNVLTKHLLDIPGALIELFGRWKLKQRDGTDCRAVLGEILKEANMGSLQTKLLEGEYLKSQTETKGEYLKSQTETKESSQVAMTEEQVLQCAKDLKSFYLERRCNLKPDPLDFNLIVEFEKLYTNLVLLRHEKGLTRDTLPLDYKNLFTTKVGGVLSKRLLVEGEGGVGKTTLCSKIALDWAQGCEEYERFSWVLVIPLRDVVKGQTIGDSMKNYLDENNSVSPKQIDYFIISQPSKVLIVLDGFDEYDGYLTDDGSDISQVLQLNKFKQCTVLVTTRPWRAHRIKCNQQFGGSYAFIAVKGFSVENVSTYISKYFSNMSNENAGKELIRFIEVNDVIKENMAPFPIYVAMLCILWANVDSEKREIIRRLKTFSQFFEEMIIFLIDHYVSKLKAANASDIEQFNDEFENPRRCLKCIGSVAFSGLLEKKLVFKVNDFSNCKEAMESCCRIGVLTRESKWVSRLRRSLGALQPVKANVSFPHKLFQEYVAALYLASLFEDDHEKYYKSLDKVFSSVQEFRYLLYFTVAQEKEVGFEIIEKLQASGGIDSATRSDNSRVLLSSRTREIAIDKNFLVDVTFEAYEKNTAREIGQRLFANNRPLTIDEKMSAHTVSGYLFIMEQHNVESLELRRKCGPTVSREIADLLSSSTPLTTLKILGTDLDNEFFSVILDNASKRGEAINKVQELHIDDRFLDGIHKFDTTIESICPNLKRLRFATLISVSPVTVKRLAHARLEELSINKPPIMTVGNHPVPLIGEPDSLGNLFSDSFPQLTSLVFKELMIGNIRTRSILQSLRKHRYLKSICFNVCFLDDELDRLVGQINAENRMKVTLQHNEKEQRTSEIKLSTDVLDALCHRTSVCELEASEADVSLRFPDLKGKEVDSKIHTLTLFRLALVNQQSGSNCLGRFLCVLPHLKHLKIDDCSFNMFNDNFYKEIADYAPTSQIHTLTLVCLGAVDQQSGSCRLWMFLSLLPHLTKVTIDRSFFHDDFYKEIADSAPLSQIHTFAFDVTSERPSQSGYQHLARFICSLPCLTNLECRVLGLNDYFFSELASLAASSKSPYFVEKKHVPML